MAGSKLREKLVDYVQDAHAMETNVQTMLNSMIATTKHPHMKARLEEHLDETRERARRLEERLDALDAGRSLRKEVEALGGALPKGLLDVFRGDKPGKNVRDGYVTESLEIAAYQLLVRLAERADDEKTARVARENLREEERMRDFLDRSWDIAIEMTLEEEGTAA